jgi:hypothetical protein
MRNVTGPDGVESLDPDTPVGGRNLIKASQWQLSPLRSHLRHVGRVSSPEIHQNTFLENRLVRSNTRGQSLPTFLAFAATV